MRITDRCTRFAGEDRRMGRFQSGHADDGRHHKIRFGVRRAGDGTFGAMDDLDSRYTGLGEPAREFRSRRFCGHGHNPRTPAACLRQSFVEVGPGRTLTGLVKKIIPGAVLHNIDDMSSLHGFLQVATHA